MTVAVLLESDGPGGAEVVVFQLAEELARRGHKVFPVGPAQGVGWLGGKFREAGFETLVFQKRHPLDPRWISDLARLFRRNGITVVHSHEFGMSVYGAAAARRLRLPHVITMHGNQTMTRALRRRMALRWAFRKSRATVAVSRATKQQLDQDLGLPPDRIQVVHNGIPIRPGNPERIRRELGVTPEERLIVAVGNLDRRKGHAVLLRALRRMEAEGQRQPWRLVIAGGRGGDQRPVLESLAAEAGHTGRLHLLAQREDVPDLLAAADIFAMPSLWEGLPLALLEAMLAGKAIVASATSGIPEAIETEVHGLLVPPGDEAALARALGRLFAEPDLRRRLGAAASGRGRAQFTIGVMVDAYERLYRGV